MKIIPAIILFAISIAIVVFAIITLIGVPSSVTAWSAFLLAGFIALLGVVVLRKGVRGAACALYDGSPDIDKLK